MQLDHRLAGTVQPISEYRQPLLALQGVSKRFGATVALDNVSLEFHRGQIHCVLGENGAGKSTIGKIMGGIHAPDGGQLLRDGRPVRFHNVIESRASGLAMVFQELSLAPDLSVRANLRLGSALIGGPFSVLRHKEEAEEARAVLASLGCDIDVEETVGRLPVACQQLVEIAKALLQKPDLIVLDEPTAMLGAAEKQALFKVLQRLKQEGKSLVLITHHIDDVMELADRISVMRNGRLVDSFYMDDRIDADIVLERLTGRKQTQASDTCARARGTDRVLRIDNLVHRNGSRTSIELHRGQIVGLYGVVGCGAENIVQALVGLSPACTARFHLHDEPFAPRSPADAIARGVSYLPSGRASNGIFASLSIRENLCLSLLDRLGRFGVVSQRAERNEALRMLQTFGVKYTDMEDRIDGLSGGNQQKVLMARAMVRARHVLVLEEPTAGIDVNAKASIHDRVRELTEQGTSVVLLSSDLLETIHLCDTVYTFYEGTVANCYERPSLEDQPSIVSDVLGQQTAH